MHPVATKFIDDFVKGVGDKITEVIRFERSLWLSGVSAHGLIPLIQAVDGIGLLGRVNQVDMDTLAV